MPIGSFRSLMQRLLEGDPAAEAEMAEAVQKPHELAMSYRVEVDTPEIEIVFDSPFNNPPVITAHWETEVTMETATPMRAVGRIVPVPFKFPVIPAINPDLLPRMEIPKLQDIDFNEIVPPLSVDVPQVTFNIPRDFTDSSNPVLQLMEQLNFTATQLWATLNAGIDNAIYPSNLILLPIANVLSDVKAIVLNMFLEIIGRLVGGGSGNVVYTIRMPDGKVKTLRDVTLPSEGGVFVQLVRQIDKIIVDVQNRLTDVFEASIGQMGQYLQVIQQQVYEKTNMLVERLNAVGAQLNGVVEGVNKQVTDAEAQLNAVFGRINSMNSSLVLAVNNISAAFTAMAEAGNEEAAQMGEFINENLLVLQDYLYAVQGIKNNELIGAIGGIGFGKQPAQIQVTDRLEHVVPGLRKMAGVDVQNSTKRFVFGYPGEVAKGKEKGKQFSVKLPSLRGQAFPIGMDSPLPPPPDEGGTGGELEEPPAAPAITPSSDAGGAPAPTASAASLAAEWKRAEPPEGYDMQVIDPKAVYRPPREPRTVAVEKPPQPVVAIPPSDPVATVVIPPISVTAEGGTTEMYSREVVKIPAVKIIAVTPASLKVANPGRGAILHFTAREPTVVGEMVSTPPTSGPTAS